MTLADDHSNCQKFFLAHNEAEAEAKMLYYVVSYVTNNRVIVVCRSHCTRETEDIM
jgi:hypothetical protein